MEISTPPPPTTVKTPDPESDPPQSTTVTKQFLPSLTNGHVLKRNNHQSPPLPVTAVYKECLKNHAAVMGGHAIDGCGEFMPSPTSSPSYPTSLKCAACGCHRNFHRRELDESVFSPPSQQLIEYKPHHRHHPPPPQPPPAAGSPGNSLSPPPISLSYYPSAPHMLIALSAGLSAPPAENKHNHHNPSISLSISPRSGTANPNGRKRFRTKFTHDQKQKMHDIAERVGWKMQKRDEEIIIGFCNEIGIDKNVFKVWMHNNKTTIGNKKDLTNNINNGNNNNNSSGEEIDFIISRNNDAGNNRLEHRLHLHNGGDSFSTGGNVILSTKGSSSSS